jgi:ketosteroid isomerase-like protein
MSVLKEITERYFKALQDGATGEALAAFYDPEVIQEEFSNHLLPRGATRDLDHILKDAELGQSVMYGHHYRIESIVVEGSRVAVEFIWSGKLKISRGSLGAGTAMRGRFATFLEFRNGRVLSQRSYDCFEPW